MKITGWLLWISGLVFAIVGTKNAKESSDVYVDNVYNARLSIAEAMTGSKIDEDDLKFDLESLQEQLTEQRKVGYLIISGLMGLGTVLILLNPKTNQSP